MDYPSNSRKEREEREEQIVHYEKPKKGKKDKDEEPQEEKKIEKLVTGNVVQKKKPLGRRFREIFLGENLHTVSDHVGRNVFLPAARNMIFDVIVETAREVIMGRRPYDRPIEGRGGYGPRGTYRSYDRVPLREPTQYARLPDQPSIRRVNRRQIQDVILDSKSEAEMILDTMFDVLRRYQMVSVADYYDMLGLETQYTDNRWGWTFLSSANIVQTRDGWVIELPPAEELGL